MWLLAGGLFATLKILSLAASRVRSSRTRRLFYVFTWPGMDADAFLDPHRKPARPPSRSEWLFAVSKLMLGVALVAGVPRVLHDSTGIVAGWLGMIGIIFTLHFGLFHLISCAFRANGIDAVPIMDWPIAARSLADFWGRRWNRAFRDLTHKFLFQPLARRLGARGGLAVGFLASGLIHELAITVPAGGGYGGPTVYFLLQGAGLALERCIKALRGRVFTFVVLIAPATLLFPQVFLDRIVLPFLLALHSLTELSP